MTSVPAERAWTGFSTEYQAARGRIVLASGFLDQAMCLLLHHLTEQPEAFEMNNLERARRYQDSYWEPFSERAKKLQGYQKQFHPFTPNTRSLGDRLVAIGEKRNIVIHGIHSLADDTPITKFRKSKNGSSDTLDTFTANVSAFDDLAVEMGAATHELVQLVSKTFADKKVATGQQP